MVHVPLCSVTMIREKSFALMNTIRDLIINVTVSFLAIYTASFIWLGLAANPPSFLYYAIGLSGAMLALLFAINVGFAVFRSKQRAAHVLMSGLIATTFLGIMPSFAKLVGNRQRSWFLNEGIQVYSLMIDKIERNRDKLTSQNGPLTILDDLVGRAHVYGRTYADGSIAIWFIGRGNWPRAGYLYYSGKQLVVKPDNTNRFVFPDNPTDHAYLHLTNGWYEF